MGTDDDRTIRRAIAGDRRAQERLWREHRRWLAAVVLAHMPRGTDLDDLLQEVALALVQKIGSLRDPQRLRGWLRTVALNVARGAARKVTLSREPGFMSLPSLAEIADPRTTGGLQREIVQERASRVLDIVRELPEAYREPLLLRALRGMSQRAIAELLGVPETTIETRIHRARRLLRDRLDPGRLSASPPSVSKR